MKEEMQELEEPVKNPGIIIRKINPEQAAAELKAFADGIDDLEEWYEEQKRLPKGTFDILLGPSPE